jgi:hypothetical protein
MFYSICPNSNLEESQKFKEGLKDLLSYVPNNMQINVFKSILADSCFEMLNNIIEEEKKQNGGVGIIKKKGGILSCKEENLKFLIKSITNKHFSNRKISKDSNRKILKEKKNLLKSVISSSCKNIDKMFYDIEKEYFEENKDDINAENNELLESERIAWTKKMERMKRENMEMEERERENMEMKEREMLNDINCIDKSFVDLFKTETLINMLNDKNIENIEIRLEVTFDDDSSKEYLLTYKKNILNIFEVTSIEEDSIILDSYLNNENKYLQPIMFKKIIETEINKNIKSIIRLSRPIVVPVKINNAENNAEGGKLKKSQKKKTFKKPVVSQNKENKYKEVLGKRMKIYKKPDSRKEFVRYKGGLVPLVEYKKTMKEIVRAKNKKH